LKCCFRRFWGLSSKLLRALSGLAGLLGPAALKRLGLAFGHPYQSLGRRAFGPFYCRLLRRLRRKKILLWGQIWGKGKRFFIILGQNELKLGLKQ